MLKEKQILNPRRTCSKLSGKMGGAISEYTLCSKEQFPYFYIQDFVDVHSLENFLTFLALRRTVLHS